MKTAYKKPVTLCMALHAETVLAAVSGSIPNQGQGFFGGGAKEDWSLVANEELPRYSAWEE